MLSNVEMQKLVYWEEVLTLIKCCIVFRRSSIVCNDLFKNMAIVVAGVVAIVCFGMPS